MTGAAPDSDRAFCVAMLPRVSRTFALGIRLLPAPLEHAVLVSYLLCRIADTIEDAPALGPPDKERLLHHLRDLLDEGDGDATALAAAFGAGRSAEEQLAASGDRVLREFRRLPEATRDAVRPWVQEMATGMAAFATRPAEHPGGGVRILRSVAELDRYCYYVAGTVGHLLTGLFALYHRGVHGVRRARLDGLATSFGLGLQLTNIVKDVTDDRRRGWTFVPQELCELAGIRPADLHDPAHAAQARTVMAALIAKARTHLRDALTYCVSLPPTAYRIRVFCLTSMFFAVRTLHLAERDPRLLDPAHKVKITRGQVYRTLVVTHVVAPFNTLVQSYYGHLARTG